MLAKKFKSLPLSKCKKRGGPMSLKELQELAKKKGIKGYSTLNKAALCTALHKHFKQHQKVTFAKYPTRDFSPFTYVTVYGRMSCFWCRMVIYDLIKLNVIFEFIDIRDKNIAEVINLPVNTVPQIYVEGKYIGGYDDFKKFLRK